MLENEFEPFFWKIGNQDILTLSPAIQILYAQSYMQTSSGMTIDMLLRNQESSAIVVGMDMVTTDVTPKSIGPRMVVCIPANTSCYPIRFVNIPFLDPFNIHVRRCTSGPNCATSGCTTFAPYVDSSFVGEMVDYGSPGVSGVPTEIFGPNARYSTGLPPNVISNTGCGAAPPPPPVVTPIRPTGVPATAVFMKVGDTQRKDPIGLQLTDVKLLHAPYYVTADVLGTLYTINGESCTDIISDSTNLGKVCAYAIKYYTEVAAFGAWIDIVIAPTVPPSAQSSIVIEFGNYIAGDTVRIKTCTPNGYMYVIDPTGKTIFKADIPKGPYPTGCRDDSYVVTELHPIGKYIVRIADYNNITLKEGSYTVSQSLPKPPPPTAFTLQTDRISMLSGETVTLGGRYKPGEKINIFYTTFPRTHITETIVKPDGLYSVSVILSTDVTKTVEIQACTAGSLGTECSAFADLSNTVSIIIAPPGTPMKWKCVGPPNYNCIQAPDGTYADLPSCQIGCKAVIPMKWKCSGPPDYTCSQAIDGTYADQASCQAACKAEIVGASHAFVINLAALSWANLDGLIAYLPNITSEFAKAITLYGWLGWQVIESRIEDSKLVIYLKETAAIGSTASKVRALALPTLAAIIAALGTITAIALRFGYIILGFYIVNLLTKAVEVAKTQADTEQIRTKTISDMCKSGALTPEQCTEALKPPPEKGICESFGFSTVACDQLKTGILVVGGLIGGYIILSAIKTITPKSTT